MNFKRYYEKYGRKALVVYALWKLIEGGLIYSCAGEVLSCENCNSVHQESGLRSKVLDSSDFFDDRELILFGGENER